MPLDTESLSDAYAPAIEVKAANGNSAAVPVQFVNVNLFDGNGDQLTGTSVGLNVEMIAPGVTITATATAFTDPGFDSSTNLWDAGYYLPDLGIPAVRGRLLPGMHH